MKTIVLKICLAMMFLSPTCLLQAAEIAGKVLSIQGGVSAIQANTGRSLKVGDKFFVGDTLLTGKDAVLQLKFTDNTWTALAANSQYVVMAYRYHKNPQQDKNVGNLVTGTARIVTGAIAKANPKAFSLQTSIATLSVQGTDWMATLQQNSLYTGVNTGKIMVSNAANTLVVSAGQFSLTAGASASQLVALSQLPAGIFGKLPGLNLPASMSPAAGTASSAGAVSAGAVATGAAAAAGAAVVGGANDDTETGITSSPQHSTTSHH